MLTEKEALTKEEHDVKQNWWPSTLFLFKGLTTFNSLFGVIASGMQHSCTYKNNWKPFPFQFTPPPTHTHTRTHTVHPPFFFYSSIMHLSFCCAHSKYVLYFVHIFQPCTLNITHCLPWTFVETNLSKQKDGKGIKVSKADCPSTPHPHTHTLFQEGVDLVHASYHYHRKNNGNGAHLFVCCFCFMVRKHTVPHVKYTAQIEGLHL